MYVLSHLIGAMVQSFNNLARRKIFSMRGVVLPRIFCGGVGRRFITDFHGIFCGGFYHGFSQFFYGGGGIILGSMSEKIV